MWAPLQIRVWFRHGPKTNLPASISGGFEHPSRSRLENKIRYSLHDLAHHSNASVASFGVLVPAPWSMFQLPDRNK